VQPIVVQGQTFGSFDSIPYKAQAGLGRRYSGLGRDIASQAGWLAGYVSLPDIYPIIPPPGTPSPPPQVPADVYQGVLMAQTGETSQDRMARQSLAIPGPA